jgi:hypothetical protein
MLYFFFNFLDTKSTAAAPPYFTVISSIKLKLTTTIGDNYIRVKIINRRLKAQVD